MADKAGISIILDSGAPTLYNRFARSKKGTFMGSFLKDRKQDDFSFINSSEYLKYRDAYIEYAKKNQNEIDICVNLDIINNAEATWQNQLYLEKAGLHPLPVWHLGEDVKWLQHYLKKGYNYIAIGGLIPNPYKVLAPALDEIWLKHLTDKEGYPIIKAHGFALTSIRGMLRWPWYSVDSASWHKYAIYGIVVIPKLDRKGNRDYRVIPESVFFSNKSARKYEFKGRHFDGFSQKEQEYIKGYLKGYGVDVGKSSFKEVKDGYILKKDEYWYNKEKTMVEIIHEIGVSNSHAHRRKMNLIYFLELQKNMPPWPQPFKVRKSRLGIDEV